MKKYFISFLLILTFLSSYSQVAFNIGSAFEDRATGISQDAGGNLYLTGVFHGSIDLDPGAGTNLLVANGDPSSPDSQDVFIARYSSAGDFDWGFSISSPGKDISYAIEVKGGLVYVCGAIRGVAEFDPGTTPAVFNSGEGQDAFIAVYDTLGAFLWAQVLGDEEGAPFEADDPRYEVAYDLSVDESGNSYLAGAFAGTMDFEPDNSSPFDSFFSVSDSNGLRGRDIFVASYDVAGNYRWGFGVGGMESEQAHAISYGNGSFYLGGKFTGTTDLNPSGQASNFVSNGDSDAFLASYQASDGTFDWAASWGGAKADEVAPGAIALGSQVVVGGSFSGMVNFDPQGGGQAASSQGGSDRFVSQFELDGSYDWTQTTGSAADDYVTDIEVDINDFVYSSGALGEKLYLEQIDDMGSSNWVREIGASASSQQIEDMVLSEEGDFYFSGTFFQNIDVDPSSDLLELSSQGASDICVVRYSAEGLLNMFGTGIDPGFTQSVKEFKMYPNPASDFLYLELTLAKKTELYIALRNPLGQVVYEENRGSQIGQVSYKFSLNSLPSSGYLLEIRSDTGSHFERILKQ